MTTIKYPTPLSPPSSPRMSGTAPKPDEHPWPPSSSDGRGQAHATATYGATATAYAHPAASSIRSPPEPPSAFGYPTLSQQLSQVQQSSKVPSYSVSGTSVPTTVSPSMRLTPRSPVAEAKEAPYGEDQDIELDDGDHDDHGEGEGGAENEAEAEASSRVLTAAEIRAQKRKMKRFRLTHQQTRYLMSEFARQAHPDAAHRERLSREIPGLSPRQVQVWFQNRRAKLKRLTADDRMRMMQSRALPASFDNTHALHAPFVGPAAQLTTPMSAPNAYGTQPQGAVRSSVVDGGRRASEYDAYGQNYAQGTNMVPMANEYSYTTTPNLGQSSSVPGTMGPGYAFIATEASRRQSFPAHLPSSMSYVGYPPSTRSIAPERYTRQSGDDNATSPLRRGVSYSDLPSEISVPRAVSYPEQGSVMAEKDYEQSRGYYPSQAETGVYGLGFSYSGVPSYTTGDDPNANHSPVARPHTGMTVDQQHYVYGPRPDSGHLAEPTQDTYPSYQHGQYGDANSYAVFPGQYSHHTGDQHVSSHVSQAAAAAAAAAAASEPSTYREPRHS